jgi:hypothetical protein
MVDDLIGAGKALEGLAKVAESAERLTRELREVGGVLVRPGADILGQYFAARLQIFLIPKMLRALQAANEEIVKSGLRAHRIEPKRLIPLLEGASLEEDDDLAFRWAGLIATAAISTDTLPAFADVLRQLTPEEARMLDFMFDNFGRVPGFVEEYVGVDKADLQLASGLSQKQFLVRVQNLHRLELITQLSRGPGAEPVRGFVGWSHSGHAGLTALGEAFVQACRGPAKLVEEGRQE